MSNAALNWAWGQTAPTSTAKLVLVALADHANADGECWPSMGSVAELAQCSTRQVARCVESLEASGLVSRKRRRGKSGKLGGYVYLLPVNAPVDTDDQRTDTSSGHGRPVDTDDQRTPEASTTGHPRHVPPDTSVRTEPSVEPSPEPSELFAPDFEGDFWQPYPKRDGKKVGKKQALEQWKRLKPADREKVPVAVQHYAQAAADPKVFCPVKDPWRWLRDRLFDDWQEPAAAGDSQGEAIVDAWEGVQSGRIDLRSVQ